MTFVKYKPRSLTPDAPLGIKIVGDTNIRFSLSLTREVAERKYAEVYFDDENKRFALKFYVSTSVSQHVYRLYVPKKSVTYTLTSMPLTQKLLAYGYSRNDFIPLSLEDGMYVAPARD